MRWLVLIVGLLGAALALEIEPPALAQVAPHCDTPPELLEDDARLPLLAERFQQHSPVTILVIGDASTAGAAPDDAYPYFLATALRRRHPGTPITVINQGGAAEANTTTLTHDVYAFPFNGKGLMADLTLQGTKITRIHPD